MPILQRNYDVIIGGAGASGLSLAWNLGSSKGLEELNILLIEDSQKDPDKTWCYWLEDGLPTPLKPDYSWDSIEIFAGKTHLKKPLAPLKYSCIKSDTYTAQIGRALEQYQNIDRIQAKVLEVNTDNPRQIRVKTEKGVYSAVNFFQSFGKPDLSRSVFPLLQHFKGIEIETSEPVFDPGVARMMDFRLDQSLGATFMYVLPFSKNKALIECTLFNEAVCDESFYDNEIERYLLEKYGVKAGEYSVTRTEIGVIPMADQMSAQPEHPCWHYIGTASGIPKASTGYAFSRIHRQCSAIAKLMAKGNKIRINPLSAVRFRIYDLMLLHILKSHKSEIVPVFESLFKNNDVRRVLRFIDEQTTFGEEIQVMLSVPRLPFLMAGAKNISTILRGV
ncbi:MAG: hypothetical protein LAT67_03655 [Balneolales bacterium]|nr:hypothetical protein [Balneolales bacterium]